MKYRIQRDITGAEGWQVFEVEAPSRDEAIELLRCGHGEIVEDEVEVTSLAEFDPDDVEPSE